MTDMSEGPNVSDERQHAEAVAREWISHNGLDAHSTSDQKHRDISSLADIIMAERTGLLARAEAAEAETKRCANGWDAAGREAKGLKQRAEAERSLREQFSDDAYDLRAKLAASEARVAELDGLRPLVAAMGENEADALRAHAERAEAEKTRAVGYLEEMAARAEKAEAAAGQMRSALELAKRYFADLVGDPDGHLLVEYCHSTEKTIDAALATDAGRGYMSPEQVAQACAAARDAALEVAANIFDVEPGEGEERSSSGAAMAIRALKVTP